jgi:hypothetical protein
MASRPRVAIMLVRPRHSGIIPVDGLTSWREWLILDAPAGSSVMENKRHVSKSTPPRPVRGGVKKTVGGTRGYTIRGQARVTRGKKPQGLTLGPGPATRERLYADVLPPDETPDMLIEAVERWREGKNG